MSGGVPSFVPGLDDKTTHHQPGFPERETVSRPPVDLAEFRPGGPNRFCEVLSARRAVSQRRVPETYPRSASLLPSCSRSSCASGCREW